MSNEPTLAELLDELVTEARDVERYAYSDRDRQAELQSRAEVVRLKEYILARFDQSELDAIRVLARIAARASAPPHSDLCPVCRHGRTTCGVDREAWLEWAALASRESPGSCG